MHHSQRSKQAFTNTRHPVCKRNRILKNQIEQCSGKSFIMVDVNMLFLRGICSYINSDKACYCVDNNKVIHLAVTFIGTCQYSERVSRHLQ